MTCDNKLDVFEFSLAMHFVELKLTGGEIPRENNIGPVENCQEVVFPVITLQDKQRIKDIFEHVKNSQGFVECKNMKLFLNTTVDWIF